MSSNQTYQTKLHKGPGTAQDDMPPLHWYPSKNGSALLVSDQFTVLSGMGLIPQATGGLWWSLWGRLVEAWVSPSGAWSIFCLNPLSCVCTPKVGWLGSSLFPKPLKYSRSLQPSLENDYQTAQLWATQPLLILRNNYLTELIIWKTHHKRLQR